MATISQQQSRRMIGNLPLHRMNKTQIINVLRNVRIKLTYVLSALTIPFKLERRPKYSPNPLALRKLQLILDGIRKRFAIQASQLGFGIEGIELRRPAIHEEMDDTLYPGREMGLFRSQRRLEFVSWGSVGIILQHSGKSQRPYTASGLIQKVTARKSDSHSFGLRKLSSV